MNGRVGEGLFWAKTESEAATCPESMELYAAATAESVYSGQPNIPWLNAGV